MKVSERMSVKFDKSKHLDGDDYFFTAINPDSGNPELICEAQYRFDRDKYPHKLDWEIDKEFLTDSELKQFQNK